MNCTNCNALLEPNAKFCGECGQLVSTQSKDPASAPSCTNCGADIEPGFLFCGECGHPVSAEPLPSGSIRPAPTLLEEAPPTPPVVGSRERPPAPSTPSEGPQPPATAPAPPTQVTPISQSPPASSFAPTVMAQDVTPPPQRPAAPPPSAAAPQPVYQQQPQEPPKKRSSGCRIILVILAFVVICCVGSTAIVLYAVNNTDFDFSSTGFDIRFLEQLQEGGFPFLDQFLDEGQQDQPFDDFFGNRVNLTLRNASDTPVCFIYISPTESDEWGDDWLSEGEIILPGDTRTFQLEPNQTFDISAFDCDENLLYEEYEIDLTSEDVVITLESAP